MWNVQILDGKESVGTTTLFVSSVSQYHGNTLWGYRWLQPWQRTGLCPLTDTVWLRRWGGLEAAGNSIREGHQLFTRIHAHTCPLTHCFQGKTIQCLVMWYWRKIFRYCSSPWFLPATSEPPRLLHNACSRLCNRSFHVTLSPSSHRIRCSYNN